MFFFFLIQPLNFFLIGLHDLFGLYMRTDDRNWLTLKNYTVYGSVFKLKNSYVLLIGVSMWVIILLLILNFKHNGS